MSTLKYWIWLASVTTLSSECVFKVLERFQTPERVFFAHDNEFKDIPGLKPIEFEKLSLKNIGAANKILSDCEESNYRVLTIQDAEYPDRLRNIYDPPAVLYVRGRLPVIDEEAAFAMVGTRNCTPYGIKTAERMSYELARFGLVIVTGLARGVDSASALGALRAGGRVVGVLGCGLNTVYPPENKRLFEDVASTGAIISEYPPSAGVTSSNFPHRNRIISGLSLGVAVIEAPKRSGALITASRALDQGRDVYSLPGNVDSPACEGSNRLLMDGATPLISAVDVASQYVALFPDKINIGAKKTMTALDERETGRLIRKVKPKNPSTQASTKKEIDNDEPTEYIDVNEIYNRLSGNAKTIAETIGGALVHVDEIITRTGLAANVVLQEMTMLEVDGYVKQSSGKYFSLAMPQETQND